jgi:hypothetical protein
MNNELRLYTFTNFMLRSIQQGIQSGHAAVELGMKCVRKQQTGNSRDWYIYSDWAENWKTMICLNGGNAQDLRELVFFLSNLDNSFPWCGFFESHDALDGSLTSVAIILPERIFKTASQLRKGEELTELTELYPESFNDWELELIDRLNNTGMAT